ncbi:MAG: GNAT family N-acetyltransferase [bacterium]
MQVRRITQEDFHWLHSFDCSPLTIERDSIYLFFCVHFGRTSFVATDSNGRPAGFLLGFLPAGGATAYIHYLFVEPVARRQGLGRRLVRTFEETVLELGAQRVALFTRRAVEFYHAVGYALDNPIFEPTLEDYLHGVKQVRVMARVL